MLPKKNKLSSEELRRVFESGYKSFKTDIFTVLLLPDKEKLAFAVVVSNKVANKAHTRNLLKRKTFSVLKDLFEDFDKGLYVFIVKKNFEKEDRKILLRDIESFIKPKR